MEASAFLFPALLQLADDHLILGHRLSEWCGHAPMLEEELALANMGLDLLGQAEALFTHAGEFDAEGRSADELAFLRYEREYLNCLLVERPNGDFAATMLRQFYFAAFMEPFWRGTAASSTSEVLRGLGAKGVKEMTYHVRHAGEWVIRLGDGTDESAARMRNAVDELHRFTGELFTGSSELTACARAGIIPDPSSLRSEWDRTIETVFAAACLALPAGGDAAGGGRKGIHGEEMGHLLAELQFMQRAYPGATW